MRRLFFILATLCLSVSVFAQNDYGKTDDEHRICLQPVIFEKSGVPSVNQNALINKLAQIATRNGIATDGSQSPFVITANVVRKSSEVTATAPVRFALDFEVSLYIGDKVTGQLFSSAVLPSVKAVATNEAKAYQQAINSIRPDNPEIQKFVADGKKKIVEYYNSQIDFILSQADALVKLEKYDEAIAILFSVPDVCKEARDTAMKACSSVFQTKIDREGAALLAEASYTWNAAADSAAAVKVVPILSKIHPLSSSAAGAAELSAKINGVLKEIGEKNTAAVVPIPEEAKAAVAEESMKEITLDVVQQNASVPDTENNENNWW